ncbi:MAG: tRNA lysidine(34) synthetase TilS [Acidobacteria bacterium]|nr:tRNA lysidine(34) synthetase TilS [Acidobacteriota bacterium]
MTALHQQVRRTIRRHGLIPPGARVLVGLSGGSDSVALARLLLDLSAHGEFTVAGLAHLHHGLRPTADRDEAFCREFAARVGLPIVVERADVPAYAAAHGLSTEDAARRLRYAFLERTAAALGATCIAVGHTEDDQAETFLLKLMRGAGLTGLGGIYPRRDTVVRPLLDVSRAELRAYLDRVGERWIDDETNEDLANPRNRVRHRVLAELDRAAGGPTRPAIARAAALVREDAQWLDELGRERFRAVAAEREGALELDIHGLTQAPPPVRRRVLLEAMRRMADGREIGLEHVEAVLGLLGGGEPGAPAVRTVRGGAERGVDVPGSRVELRGEKLVFLRQTGR